MLFKKKKTDTKSYVDTCSYNRFDKHSEVLSQISKLVCKYAVKCYEISTDDWRDIKNSTRSQVSEYMHCEVSNSDIWFHNSGPRSYNYRIQYESYGMANIESAYDVKDFIKALIPYLKKDFPAMISNSLSILPYQYRISIDNDNGSVSVFGDGGFDFNPEIEFNITFETGKAEKVLKRW